MASRTRTKTKTASARKTSSSRSSRARTKTEQTSTAAGDNATGAAAINAAASREAAVRAQNAAAEAATADIPPKVANIILNPGEPVTSLNSLPKDEGGLPADVIAGIRSSVDSARGSAALGQPGQLGHGVGTAFDDTPVTDEERAANEEEYRRRFGGTA